MPEFAGASGGIVMAAGRHGHHAIRLIILVVIILVVIAAVIVTVRLVTRGRRSSRPPNAPAPSASLLPTTATPSARPVPQDAAVAADHLVRSYQMGKIEVRALDDVSIQVMPGAMACIMGRSGSGKSTLLRQFGLIDLPTAGSVWLRGEDVTRLPEHRRRELRLRALGYIFQEYALLPELTATENVYLPALMAGQSMRRCRARALEVLELVGLAHRARHRPREMSGGEQQRVAIARALMNEPAIIFADEPTASLDTASARTVMQTLRRLNESLGVTVVFVSHDPDDAQYATQVIYLRDGKVAGESAADGTIGDGAVSEVKS